MHTRWSRYRINKESKNPVQMVCELLSRMSQLRKVDLILPSRLGPSLEEERCTAIYCSSMRWDLPEPGAVKDGSFYETQNLTHQDTHSDICRRITRSDSLRW